MDRLLFLFILAMAAAEVSVGLALVLQLYHRFKSLDADAAERDERDSVMGLLWLIAAMPLGERARAGGAGFAFVAQGRGGIGRGLDRRSRL